MKLRVTTDGLTRVRLIRQQPGQHDQETGGLSHGRLRRQFGNRRVHTVAVDERNGTQLRRDIRLPRIRRRKAFDGLERAGMVLG